MANVFQCILRDHRRIESLFDEAVAVLHSARGRPLWYQVIRDEMRVHGFAEETVVYPFLKRTRDTEVLAQEAGAEQDRIDDILDELDVLDGRETAWRTRFEKLRSLFYAHVTREEGDIFPHLRRYFPESALEALCPKYEKAREEARNQSAA